MIAQSVEKPVGIRRNAGAASVTSELRDEDVLSRGILSNSCRSTSVWSVELVPEKIPRGYNSHFAGGRSDFETDLRLKRYCRAHVDILRERLKSLRRHRKVIRIVRNMSTSNLPWLSVKRLRKSAKRDSEIDGSSLNCGLPRGPEPILRNVPAFPAWPYAAAASTNNNKPPTHTARVLSIGFSISGRTDYCLPYSHERRHSS